MAKTKQQKEEKEEKKKRKQNKDSSMSYVLMAVGVVIAAVVVGMPQLMKARRASPFSKLSFPTPPDPRPAACARDGKVNDVFRESVSVIIPYLNEEWFRIRNTMESIIAYTDMSLVREIMWISDGNTPEKVFASELKAFHPKVSVHENPTNLGLIVTKMNAAKFAKGSILMFLEPHVAVNVGWLQPLVNRLEAEPKALVMPSLDVLDNQMKYHVSGLGHWRFEWNLNLVFTEPVQRKPTALPYMSPATSGGIYAIRKDWWDHLELFDPELISWGGDHVEATHKVWRCGGKIEIHPCSRIGHWFRHEEQRPYSVKVESVVRNYKRLAEVWFDDAYISRFYKCKPDAKDMDMGNITEMKSRRSALQCKDMKWYVENVDVELGWEADKICIPGAAESLGGCGEGTKAAPHLSAVTQGMPGAEYKRQIASAEGHQAYKTREPCCRAKGRGCMRICDPGEAPTFEEMPARGPTEGVR